MRLFVIHEDASNRTLLTSAETADEALAKVRAWFTPQRLGMGMCAANDTVSRLNDAIRDRFEWTAKNNAWKKQINDAHGQQYELTPEPKLEYVLEYDMEQYMQEFNLFVEQELDASLVIELEDVLGVMHDGCC